VSLVASLEKRIVSSSFRDPSGFVYWQNGELYRQINPCYRENYKRLMESGLYNELVGNKLLVHHKQVSEDTIVPDIIPFVSYPYEWCFSQLKDAALATLATQKTAMDFGMTLKDASAYNIQFLRGQPVLIDTLSFATYQEGKPWIPYRQFCQYFLNPLALMALKDIRLSQLLRVYIDGIPIDLTAKLLPSKTYFNPGLLTHIKTHALSQNHLAGKKLPIRMSKTMLTNFVNNLENTVKNLRWKPKGNWVNYGQCSYSEIAQRSKQDIVTEYLVRLKPKLVWDLGANNGLFSDIAAGTGAEVIALDSDPACVELCYQKYKGKILPLVVDLINPTPSIGWRNEERVGLLERNKPDTVMALAFIHHLAISNNLPLKEIASFLDSLCNNLIVEWVPKDDLQVQKMLSTREDIFVDYNQSNFEDKFEAHFRVIERQSIMDSARTLYLMERR